MRSRWWDREVMRRDIAFAAVVVLLIVGGIVFGVAPEGRPPTAAESWRIGWHDPSAGDALARDIFERVNDERAARGSPPLSWHEGLADLARSWSEEMIATGAFEHSTDAYRMYPDVVVTGENIAIDEGSAQAHVALMRSDGHRANILEPAYDTLGVGVVCRRDGLLWVTQIFGVTRPPGPTPAINPAENPIVRDDRGMRCP